MKRRKQSRSADFRQALHWQPLKRGDIVEIIAPGSGTPTSDLKRAVRFIRSLGFKPRVQPGILKKGSALLAAPDDLRLKQLKKALTARDSRAIWCLRGGYGSLRLLSELNRVRPPARSKVLLGYSDITSLHLFLNLFWRWPSLHTPNLDRLSKRKDSPADLRELEAMLKGQKSQLTFKNLKALNAPARRKRRVNGAVVGGNLCVYQSGLGTPWTPFAGGKILFFEDVGEKAHRLDRMLTQLKLSGGFRGVKAIVFGDLLIEDKKQLRLIWQEVIARFARETSIPVLKGLPCGHGKRQRALPLMTPAQLDMGPRSATLSVESGAL